MVKYSRPFWRFNIVKIEQWLSFMASQGQFLVRFKPFPGSFFFRPAPPQKIELRIGYAPKGEKDATVQKGLGWTEVARHKNYFILTSALPPAELKYYPARDGAVDRSLLLLNRTQLAFFTLLAVFFASSAIYCLLLTCGLATPPTWETFSHWKFWLKIALVLFAIIHLTLSHWAHRLLHGNHFSLDTNHYPTQLIVKRKLGWTRQPDKLEKWLEMKERQGYQLLKVGKIGVSFFFAKGEPRNMRYSVDFRGMADRSYFASHRETGWRLFFTQQGSFALWTIWGKAYETEATPPLYTDRTHMRRHALRVLASQLVTLVPLLIFYSAYLKAAIEHPVLKGLRVVYGLALLIYIILILQLALYYRRIRKQTAP